LAGGTVWTGTAEDQTDRGLNGRCGAEALLWGEWLAVTGAVFSYMAGIIHPYYTVALAPPIAALAALGAVRLWRERAFWPARAVLAAGIAVTAGWSFVPLDRSPSWHPWLRFVVLAAGLASAAGLLTGGLLTGRLLEGGLVSGGPVTSGRGDDGVAGRRGGRAGRGAGRADGLQPGDGGGRAYGRAADGRAGGDQLVRGPGGAGGARRDWRVPRRRDARCRRDRDGARRACGRRLPGTGRAGTGRPGGVGGSGGPGAGGPGGGLGGSTQVSAALARLLEHDAGRYS
jgi:hypothetical protein